jgi:hypothetical protein
LHCEPFADETTKAIVGRQGACSPGSCCQENQ